ncbi:hypothetical protein QQS21_010540 [Conoideocrella luteorostrata]|uniref:Uncharacterized protein n=1 Tax=Conoideocrella luteorostrata TaxID=1105319 RepID=A0AAJ0CF03_9HYPO|nr:hypothetical protein QQS21_010540 [Conoideocrella luteorostrata]
MDAPVTANHNAQVTPIQVMPAKNDAPNHVSPPPAYSNPFGLRAMSVEEFRLFTSVGNNVELDRSPLVSILNNHPNDMDLDYGDGLHPEEGQSPICLRINTSVKVCSSSNIVCIKDTPSEHANAIARAVVQAIQENSSGQCGIPMVDEDGRPRPIKIEVDASMEVEGQENVVGNEDVIGQALQQRRKRDHQDDEDEDSEASSSGSVKRSRS